MSDFRFLLFTEDDTMEFKRCERCGSFFMSNESVCHHCLTKEKFEISQFKNFIEENNISEINTINDLSIQTGIAAKNLNRFLGSEDFSDVASQFQLK